ncbi:hypothetical protein ACLMJK_009384 [Lecanora helva]
MSPSLGSVIGSDIDSGSHTGQGTSSSTSGKSFGSGNDSGGGQSGGASGAGAIKPASTQPIVTTDIVYTTVTVSPITKTVEAGHTSSTQVIDSTYTITQTTTITICNHCAVATTNTVTAYITATSSLERNAVVTQISSVHQPAKSIPAQSYPVYYNSTGPYANITYHFSASAFSKPIKPVSEVLSSGGAIDSSASVSGRPLNPTSVSGSRVSHPSILNTGSTYHMPPFSKGPSGGGFSRSISSATGSGISQSAFSTGTSYSQRDAASPASSHTSALYHTGVSVLSSQGASSGTAVRSSRPPGTSTSRYQSGVSGHSVYPSGSLSYSQPLHSFPGISFSNSNRPTGSVSKPTGTGYSGSISPSGTGSQPISSPSGSGFSRVTGNGYTKLIPPSGTGNSGSVQQSGAGTRPLYPLNTGSAATPSSATASKPLYLSSSTAYSNSGMPSGTVSQVSTASSPMGTGSRSVFSLGTVSGSKIPMTTNATSNYYLTNSPVGTGPKGLALSSGSTALTSVATSVTPSAASSIAVPVISSCVTQDLAGTFKLEISGTADTLHADGQYLGIEPLSRSADDVSYYTDFEDSANFLFYYGNLVTRDGTKAGLEVGNINPEDASPSLLRFDTITAASQTPVCRDVRNTLVCNNAGTPLVFYGCTSSPSIQLSADVPTTEENCVPLTLHIVYNEVCIPSTSVVPTSIGPTVVMPTSVLPSVTVSSSIAPSVTSACVPLPAETFILQGLGSFAVLYSSQEGGDLITFDDEHSASRFSLAPGTNALVSEDGSSGLLETGNVRSEDALFRFDTADQLLTESGSTQLPSCSITGGVFTCDIAGTPGNFYSCRGALGVFITTGDVPSRCNGFTFTALALDGSVAPDTSHNCASSGVGVATSAPPSVNIPPTLSSVVASMTSDLASVTSACIPSAPLAESFILETDSLGDTMYSTLQYSNEEGDDILYLTTNNDGTSLSITGTTVTADPADTHSFQYETATIHHADRQRPFLSFSTAAAIASGVYPDQVTPLSCSIGNDNSFTCDYVFFKCDDSDAIRVSAVVSDNCQEITFTAVPPGGNTITDCVGAVTGYP